MSSQPRSTACMPATSPWTEAYTMHFDGAEFSAFMQAASANEEEQPTREALVDVYNRETETQPTSAFVFATA